MYVDVGTIREMPPHELCAPSVASTLVRDLDYRQLIEKINDGVKVYDVSRFLIKQRQQDTRS